MTGRWLAWFTDLVDEVHWHNNVWRYTLNEKRMDEPERDRSVASMWAHHAKWNDRVGRRDAAQYDREQARRLRARAESHRGRGVR